jgi:four helix bundle protein
LYRAVGSISVNLAEGYSRISGKDRALFYQYSLGSTREARDWYFKARHILGDEIFNARVHVITEILRLLIKMISQQRGYLVDEDSSQYETNPD